VALSNCTAALRVALLALGVGSGDRVAVTPYSWVATANVIELCGATPVFVDVDPRTFNMDPELLSVALGDGALSAVMPVHTFGNPAGIDHIVDAAAAAGVPVVEDAACALGARIGSRAAGSLGVASCFSFHPRKIITTGEGGMLVTDRADIAAFAQMHRNHGQQPIDGVVQFVAPGDNLRITEMQGALGVVQMGRLAGLVESRSTLAARYDSALDDFAMTPQSRAPGAAVQSYVALTPAGVAAADVVRGLRERQVEATIGTNAIPFTRYYEQRYGKVDSDLPATAMLRDRAVTLPLFPSMTTAEQDDVLAALAEVLR
jgi:dTDP-4-amino-4,6-dideoxygalactose transaminase